MKHGVMNTMWKQKCSPQNELEKFAEAEKGVAGQFERESHVDGLFDIEGVVCIINSYVRGWYYLEVLKRLRENVRRNRPLLWRNSSWFLHHGNATVSLILYQKS
jgi:hypothetical protein